MSVNRELHKGGDRSCMHIEFDISQSKLRYDAGDHVAVFPVNDAEIVEKLGARLSVDLGTVFTLTNLDGVFFVYFCIYFLLSARAWLVERRSLTGELSLSCTRHAADG